MLTTKVAVCQCFLILELNELHREQAVGSRKSASFTGPAITELNLDWRQQGKSLIEHGLSADCRCRQTGQGSSQAGAQIAAPLES
jgi:hypothetical protein